MIKIIQKDQKEDVPYQYAIKGLEELTELMHVIYKPILQPAYDIKIELKEYNEVRHILTNRSMYEHLNLYIFLPTTVYKYLLQAMPSIGKSTQVSLLDYFKKGITDRHLLIDSKAVYPLYNSIKGSYSEVDGVLDLLLKEFGAYNHIYLKDLQKYFVIDNLCYPRQVLLSYIQMDRYRKSKLKKCRKDFNENLIIASMVKNVKVLHKQKLQYLQSGIGKPFIKNLNTKNLNLMYYVLVVKKPYSLNNIGILMDIYERGVWNNDIF